MRGDMAASGKARRDGMAALIAARDWSDSPIGGPAQWGASLRTAVGMMLPAQAQIVLFWGPEFVALYNDAYAASIGDKHPRALGRPARENWAELWDDLEPLLRGVYETGETYSAKDRPFYIERHGYGETVYFDVSYSAVPEIDGSVGGVLCIVSETTERVLAERRVRESERRFRALVNATADMVYRMSPDWRELRRLEGQGMLADKDAASIDWIDEYVLPEDQPEVQAAVDRAIAHHEPFELEHRVRRADGSIGWIASRAVPVFDDRGELVEWFGAASDVSERRRASEHLQLVIHELNHRVKNTLAMMQSIALQTFRRIDDLPEAQERFSARLVALAQANDLLTGERWSGATLGNAIEQAVRPHRPAPERMALDGPEVPLASKTALAVTLAMHELATNAVKYGAWSNASGCVTVTWAIEEQPAGKEMLRLRWAETGGPEVRPPARRGFGSRLIERGLAGEMNGQVRMAFEPGGLECTIEAPLEREQDR